MFSLSLYEGIVLKMYKVEQSPVALLLILFTYNPHHPHLLSSLKGLSVSERWA